MNTVSPGELGLIVAVLAAAASVFFAVLAAKNSSKPQLDWSRRLMCVFMLAIIWCSWVLMSASINSDFTNAYIASYTERALPIGYKIAAFWAGQQGSLLLWALLLAVMSVVAIYSFGKRQMAEQAALVSMLALACGFFAALMLFVEKANPFVRLPMQIADGRGLNPLLQDPYMIAHPPMLFVGYAGYTIPWAMLLAALIASRKDNQWIGATRKWLMVSWVFLTVGIILGAKWAYIELGWGGYWAWDPVENASLLPWLTGTALLHSVMIQQHRGMFKVWNAVLIAVTFLLCIFGTYLTRSGVIQSVHSFGESPIGTFFLTFMVVCTLISAYVLIVRRSLLNSEGVIEGLFTKEGAFLAVNVLLVLITLTTLVGTIFPLISGVFMKEPVSVGANFYNKVVIPLGLALLAVMSVGPLLDYGKDAGKRLAKSLTVPAIVAIVAVIVALAFRLTDPWALVCTAIAAVAGSSVLVGIVKAVKQRRAVEDEDTFAATLRVIDSNHRRYGGQFVHVGMVLFMIGAAGSSLFGVTQNLRLAPGETTRVNGYTITFGGLHQQRYANYDAMEARVDLRAPGETAPKTLHPQMRFYDKSEQPSAQVAISSNLKRDAYLTLAGWNDDGSLAAIQAIINPLVAWIWIGGIVMTVGAIFCLLPRLIREPKAEATPKPVNGKAKATTHATIHLPLAGDGGCVSESTENQPLYNLEREAVK